MFVLATRIAANLFFSRMCSREFIRYGQSSKLISYIQALFA